MQQAFERTELLLGKKALEKLAHSRVAVFGLGGVGGYAVEALVRSGIGALDLVDHDIINFSNLNRQILATHQTIGRYKTDAAYERVKSINPNCKVKLYQTFYTSELQNEFEFEKYDYIIDAIDTVSAKIALVTAAQKANTPIISAMSAGNKLCPEKFEVADIYKTSVCPLAHIMRKELRKKGIKSLKVVYSTEKPIQTKISSTEKIIGSIAFVPPVVGLIIASEVVKDLTSF